MAKNVKYTLWNSIRETLSDLTPFPGRVALSCRLALVCSVVAGVSMMLEVPETAISCYLVVLIMKDDSSENIVMGLVIIFVVTLLISLMVPLIQYTVESALMRILMMITISFVFVFLGAATKFGKVGNVIALIITYVLALVSQAPLDEIISYALRYVTEMVTMPMLVIIGFSFFFGRWSISFLRGELRERLFIAQSILQNDGSEQVCTALLQKLEAANKEELKRSALVKTLHLTSRAKALQIKNDILASYQLLFTISALPTDFASENRVHYAQHIGEMIAALDKGVRLPSLDRPAQTQIDTQEIALVEALQSICGGKKPEYNESEAEDFIEADAFSSPVYHRFALKTTLAAMLCYMLYTASDWQGIHTAMITCYAAAMGTAGDTVHKLALRLTGCLIGAAVGLASIVFLMPHMESVGSLMVLVFVMSLPAAWITIGSEKISYGGVQIILAFTLIVLHGFGTTTDMEVARDRVIGVLIGNTAVYIVSTLIWSIPVITNIQSSLCDVIKKIKDVAGARPEERLNMVSTVAEIEKLLGEIRYCFYLLPFEPRRLRPSQGTQYSLIQVVQELSNLNREVYFSSLIMSETVARLDMISENISSGGINNSPTVTERTSANVVATPKGTTNQIEERHARLEKASGTNIA